jgi:hypothetical protein
MAKHVLTPNGEPMDYKVEKLKAKKAEEKKESQKKKAQAKKKAKK